jgi:hypothetical protein
VSQVSPHAASGSSGQSGLSLMRAFYQRHSTIGMR